MLKYLALAKKYAKFLPPALATVVAALLGLLHPGMSTADWAGVVSMAAGSLAVLIAPNVPDYKYVKETLYAISAVATIAVTGLVSGFTFQTDAQMVLAALAAFGVAGVKNIGDYLHIATAKANANVPEGPADVPVTPAVPAENAPAPVVVTPAETPAPPAETSTAPGGQQ